MKDKIINLVGPSGSGKTTIAKELEKIGYNIIHSYATREPREKNEWGHKFIKGGNWYEEDIFSGADEEFEREIKIHASAMIAYKDVYESGGDEVYFATKEQYQGKGISIYVVCPDGAEQVRKNVKDAEVVTIFLMCDEGNRYTRLSERHELTPKVDPFEYREKRNKIYERIYKDKEIFKVCKCNYTVDANREVKEVLEDVVSIIERG